MRKLYSVKTEVAHSFLDTHYLITWSQEKHSVSSSYNRVMINCSFLSLHCSYSISKYSSCLCYVSFGCDRYGVLRKEEYRLKICTKPCNLLIKCYISTSCIRKVIKSSWYASVNNRRIRRPPTCPLCIVKYYRISWCKV